MPKRKTVSTEGSFGSRMAELRHRAGLSQRALAAELGISQRMVAYYEGQTEHPPAHLLGPLCAVLGVSSDALLGLKPVKQVRGPTNQRLWRRFQQIEKLPLNERRQLLGVVDAFLDRHRLVQRAS
jgi:transcriptional regulator with XRE-family HTH domain